MFHLPRRPKTKRGALLAIGGGVLVAAAVALALVYFVLFPTSSPKRFTLTPPSTSSTSSPSTGTAKGVAGRWTIASGSLAGYRVREKLAFLPAESDAVGRTSAITGEATFRESKSKVTVTAASFAVDVSKLTSDRSMRDQRIRTIGLESDRYPRATFALSTPLTLPASALSGRVVHVSATGVFNIHGTKKRETVKLTMRLSNSAIETVGSITFPWGEFNMTAPSVGGFVNVTNKATMEFDLHLKRA
jgi:polyisoprenoid-binding protein YceI